MASAKRIFGTLFFIIASLATFAFVFLLFERAQGSPAFKEYYDSVPLIGLIIGAILCFIIVMLTLFLLVRGSQERARRQAFQEEQDRLASERERLASFEASLEEPEKIGWGPDIVVYNLPTISQMYRAWEKYNRRTKSVPFYYPRSVDSAVYTNNYIPIDNEGTMLKLRTLIAGPPGAQSKDAGMAHTKRPVTIDPKVLATLDPKLRASYEKQQEEIAENAAPMASGVTAATLGIIAKAPKKKEAAKEEAPLAPTPPMQEAAETTTMSSGRSTMLQEMEARFTPGAEPGPRAYYDYDGDVADVEAVEGIGRIYGEKLRNVGVYTTARLCYEDPQSLADRVGVPRRTVEQWKSMAELIKVSGIGPQYAEALARSGIDGIQELKRRSPGAISEQVNTYLDSLHTNVVGTKITEARVKGWQKAAAKMKKVRLKAPEK